MTRSILSARRLFRATQILLIAGVVTAGMAAAMEDDLYKGYELPPYEVKDSQGAFELRRYSPHILAEVTVAGRQGQAVSRGFQVLANYIFGGNATGEKIAMTTPVAQTPRPGAQVDQEGRALWTVSFMMPAKFDVAALPAAQSASIRFVEIESEDVLVLRFSGLRSAWVLSRKADELVDEAEARGFALAGAPRYLFYDGPMTPPWARRNEIAVPIARVAATTF